MKIADLGSHIRPPAELTRKYACRLRRIDEQTLGVSTSPPIRTKLSLLMPNWAELRMSRASWTPSIVPTDEDETVYLVADDFGKLGRAWREADYEATDLETVIQDLLTGQYRNPVRVVPSIRPSAGRRMFRRMRQRAATPLRSGAAGSLGFRHRFCGSGTRAPFGVS